MPLLMGTIHAIGTVRFKRRPWSAASTNVQSPDAKIPRPTPTDDANFIPHPTIISSSDPDSNQGGIPPFSRKIIIIIIEANLARCHDRSLERSRQETML